MSNYVLLILYYFYKLFIDTYIDTYTYINIYIYISMKYIRIVYALMYI